MKKLFFVVIIVIFLFSCTKQQKANRPIKKYLDSVLNDPHSYESVNTEIDTFHINSPYLIPEYKKLKDKFNYDEISFIGEEKTDVLNKLKVDTIILKHKMKEIEDKFEKYDDGWYITHTYRAKNGFGALGLHKIVVHEDANFTTIKEIIFNN